MAFVVNTNKRIIQYCHAQNKIKDKRIELANAQKIIETRNRIAHDCDQTEDMNTIICSDLLKKF